MTLVNAIGRSVVGEDPEVGGPGRLEEVDRGRRGQGHGAGRCLKWHKGEAVE